MPEGKVDIYCEHPYGEPDLNGLTRLAEEVLHTEKWLFDVTVVLVDDDAIVRLNRSYLGKTSATDVIAFQVDEDNQGEIYINLDAARKQALDLDEQVDRAVRRLLIHGILHLGGWNDATEEERSRMLEYGDKYLT